MADGYIKCKTEDSDGVITHVGVASTPGGMATTYTKARVVSMIDTDHKVIYTAIRRNGSWQAGEHVHTVAGKYLRTDRNNTPKDNLGNVASC